MTFNQDIPTGPFDITDRFGNDRLVFTHNFVGPTTAATQDLANRAEELYRERTLVPSEPNESASQVVITGDETYEIEVEIFQPAYDLEAARQIRGQLETITPSSTIVSVDVETLNVSRITGRNRNLLSETLWMRILTRKVLDLAAPEEGIIEANIRDETSHYDRIDLKNPGDNFFIDLRVKEAIMQDLIEFGAGAGDVIRRRLDTDIGAVQISAGNNFNVSR